MTASEFITGLVPSSRLTAGRLIASGHLFAGSTSWLTSDGFLPRGQSENFAKLVKHSREMNLYKVYSVSRDTGPMNVRIEALNSAGAKAQVEARYPGAYNITLIQLPSSSKEK